MKDREAQKKTNRAIYTQRQRKDHRETQRHRETERLTFQLSLHLSLVLSSTLSSTLLSLFGFSHFPPPPPLPSFKLLLPRLLTSGL